LSEFDPNRYDVHDKQVLFMQAIAMFVCYGGARGGGKSWALDFKCCCLAMAYPGIQIILIRKTLKECKKNHVPLLKQMIKDSARWSETDLAFYWKNGSTIQLGYCDTAEDLNHLQGQTYQIVCIDEATQFTYEEFTILCAISRGGENNWPKRIYLTCNPGGVGHAWVKRIFIDKQYAEGERPQDYIFIQALATDNPSNGNDYIHKLDLLPDDKKSGWRYGNWDAVTGNFFNEWNDKVHVILPVQIPENSRRYFVMDYGLDMLAGYWIAVDYTGTAYVYREIYQGNDAKEGTGLIISDAAKAILAMEDRNENVFVRIAPPDLWSTSKSSGKTQAEEFAQSGLSIVKADNSRIDGWMALREWLKVYKTKDKNGNPILSSRLKVFSTCPNLIRTMSSIQYDTKKNNDAAKIPHELSHAPDALRYWAISRPFGSTVATKDRHFDFEDMQEEYERQKSPMRGYIGGEVTSSYLNYGG